MQGCWGNTASGWHRYWSGRGAAAAARQQSRDHGQAVVRDVLRDLLQHLYRMRGVVADPDGDAVEAVQA